MTQLATVRDANWQQQRTTTTNFLPSCHALCNDDGPHKLQNMDSILQRRHHHRRRRRRRRGNGSPAIIIIITTAAVVIIGASAIKCITKFLCRLLLLPRHIINVATTSIIIIACVCRGGGGGYIVVVASCLSLFHFHGHWFWLLLDCQDCWFNSFLYVQIKEAYFVATNVDGQQLQWHWSCLIFDFQGHFGPQSR